MYALGSRVRLLAPVDRFPDFVAPPGATGTVVETGDGAVWVRLDAPLPGAEPWNNSIMFTLEHGDVLEETLGTA
jgi:hypothetical protein